jgi:AbrB family looped-hinge helix DNA binding protein
MKVKILGTSKLSAKFQVTIPKDARDFLNIKSGERLVFKSKDGELVLQKA